MHAQMGVCSPNVYICPQGLEGGGYYDFLNRSSGPGYNIDSPESQTLLPPFQESSD